MTQIQNRDYEIVRVGASEADRLHGLMRLVWEKLDDKSLFAVEDLDTGWMRDQLDGGFGIEARTGDGEPVGMLLVCRYGLAEENLGHDLGYPETMLPYVCNVECAAVLPEHRGNGLQKRMLAAAEEELRGSGIRVMAATASPDNAASVKSLQAMGYRIVLTRNKYGGYQRHVLRKSLPTEEA